MITDSQTNMLYLADKLSANHPEFYKRFIQLLSIQRIAVELLPDTKDIWAVDYMPVQISPNRFVQFQYKPDYLMKYEKWRRTISDVDAICDSLNLVREKSDIILDGGNVVKSKSSVILCDKVFYENPQYSRKALTHKLKDLFEVESLLFVPQQPGDITGHADAMVRFVDENTVLINNYSAEKSEFHRAFNIAIDNAGLDYIELPYNLERNKTTDGAIGCYVNYLQMENLLVVPTYNMKEDDSALKILETTFAGNIVVPLNCIEIAAKGGVLNCITWNIKTT